ncbi:MAG: zf-TFIIB domain-containing protein [Bacteroidetes bacterium]|nr:zf-TFIIB domain-containing protein [Bacteroidota bacterium]
MNCPNCGIGLHTKSIQGIEIEECGKCEGIWFEKDKLRQIKDRTDSDLNWMDFEIWKHPEKFKSKSKRSNCPRCEKSMNVLDYDTTKVEIDYCAECKGIWLEKDEFQKIIDALEEEILTMPMGEYVKSTIEEAKELLTGPESFLSEWKDFSTILRFLQYRILSLKPKVHDSLVTFQNNPLNR